MTPIDAMRNAHHHEYVADSHTRYLLACTGFRSNAHGAQAVFEKLFREYGLPRAIRADKRRPARDDRSPRIVDAEPSSRRSGAFNQFRKLYNDERPARRCRAGR